MCMYIPEWKLLTKLQIHSNKNVCLVETIGQTKDMSKQEKYNSHVPQELRSGTIPLVRTYVDKHGRTRCTGIKQKLKQSQFPARA